MGQGGQSTLRGGYKARKARQNDEAGQDDVKRQIDSDLNDSKQIYKLINVKTGGGKLIDIIKSRAKQHSLHSSSTSFGETGGGGNDGSHNRQKGSASTTSATDQRLLLQEFDQAADEQIRQLVEPLLYNRGRGKLMPLAHIWKYRFGFASGGAGSSTGDQLNGQADVVGASSGEPTASVSLETGGPSRGGPARFRWVCWRLEERGFVGETALHICFLLSTPTHMILAKRLLNLFPMLINDIYTCDEYFGESSLHMAIVNEDVRIVKLLLDHGANVHERCLGSFFLPDDQKEKANGSIRRHLQEQNDEINANWLFEELMVDLQSNHLNDSRTNYEGFTYWGEYPLSFAASLGLTDCYKLLLAKGASPNRLDSNGNSTLHICVIANRLDMFDLCYSNGADLGITNKLGLSPLALAAKLRRVDMFFHILTIMRNVNWVFCNVGFVDLPLNEIDSINTVDGSCNDQSVLSIVVSGNSNEHLQMLDGLLSDLLQIKWKTSVCGRFRRWLILFIGFLIIAAVAYLTRLDVKSASKWIQDFEAANNDTKAINSTGPRNNLAYRVASDYKLANHYSELLVVLCVVYYLLILIKRCIIDSLPVRADARVSGGGGTHVFNLGSSARASAAIAKVLLQVPELIIFTTTCLLIVLCVPIRLLLGWRNAEDILVTIIMFLMPLKLLFFCRGSQSLGSFIVMIYKILVNDVLCFVVFLIIFIAGFSQSFMLIFKTYRPSSMSRNGTAAALSASFFESLVKEDESYFLNFYDSFIMLHMMALNEFSWVVDEFAYTEYPNLARVLFCVYMILVSILLVNMLIAMLGKTYQDIASQPNENLRQWARALLIVERMCSRRTRLKMLDRYSTQKQLYEIKQADSTRVGLSKLNANDKLAQTTTTCRCFSFTWALSDDDSKQISAIKRLNDEHLLNSRRLARMNNIKRKPVDELSC